jgi:hypothetical protein
VNDSEVGRGEPTRIQLWRESLALEWQLRDPGWWVGPLLAVAFFATPVVMGLVYAAITGNLWGLLVLAWPAVWLLMWLGR